MQAAARFASVGGTRERGRLSMATPRRPGLAGQAISPRTSNSHLPSGSCLSTFPQARSAAASLQGGIIGHHRVAVARPAVPGTEGMVPGLIAATRKCAGSVQGNARPLRPSLPSFVARVVDTPMDQATVRSPAPRRGRKRSPATDAPNLKLCTWPRGLPGGVFMPSSRPFSWPACGQYLARRCARAGAPSRACCEAAPMRRTAAAALRAVQCTREGLAPHQSPQRPVGKEGFAP